MNRILALALLMAAALTARADYYRVWALGPLAPVDFSIEPAAGQPTRFVGQLVQTVGTIPDGRTTLTISAVIFPEKSVGSRESLSPQRLQWHQLQFDELELQARRVQREVNKGLSGRRIDKLIAQTNSDYAATIDRWRESTADGTDTIAVRMLRADLDRQLAELPDVDDAVLTPSHFGYGVYVATGPHWTTGTLHDAVGWAWDFTFGLRAIYRRVHLNAQITYASASVLNPLMISDDMDPITPGFIYRANIKDANYLGAGVSLGIDLLNSKTYSLVPFAGGMFSQYSWSAKPSYLAQDGTVVFDGLQDGVTLSTFNVWFGAEFEWHFHRALSSSGIMGAIRQQLTSSIGIRPYAVRQIYKKNTPHAAGWNIGITISYSGIIRNMGVSKK